MEKSNINLICDVLEGNRQMKKNYETLFNMFCYLISIFKNDMSMEELMTCFKNQLKFSAGIDIDDRLTRLDPIIKEEDIQPELLVIEEDEVMRCCQVIIALSYKRLIETGKIYA